MPERLHLVTALHACDTATDDALLLAIRHNADHVAVVPCCQAEVARQLADAPAPAPAVAPLFEHPWHRREFGSHLTNVVRALALEANGYKVTVTELTGWEHSVKNELILGPEAPRRLARGQGEARRAARGDGGAPEARPRPARVRRDGRRRTAPARSRGAAAPVRLTHVVREGHATSIARSPSTAGSARSEIARDGRPSRPHGLARPRGARGREAPAFVLVLYLTAVDCRIDHLGFQCAARGEVDRLAAQGESLGILAEPPFDGGGDIGYVTMLRDPDGHLVEFTFGQPLRGL